MGQSNMSGYGKLEPGDDKPVPGVLRIPTKGDLAWEPAAHPLHNRLPSDRFGLGLPFAKAYMKQHPNAKVGLIPVAWGGAAISKLGKGTATYADAIKKAEFAQQQGVRRPVGHVQQAGDLVVVVALDVVEHEDGSSSPNDRIALLAEGRVVAREAFWFRSR